MILFKNHLVELTYEVKHDLLLIYWPHLNQEDLLELEFVFSQVIDTLNHYDIKHLLIDSSQSLVEIDEFTYKALLFQFVQRLSTTRLKKMARIMSESTVRENRLKGYAQEMEVQQLFTFSFAEFENKLTAVSWLTKVENW